MANLGPRGDPKANLSTCLNKVSLKLEKSNQSLTVYSLMVLVLRTGTGNLASWYAGNIKTDRMGLKGEKSTNLLWTLLKAYMITDFVPFGLF